jgi:hypothetical protein
VLSRRTLSLSPDEIKKKGEEIASSVRSALGFWDSNAASLNAKILNQYYAALQFSIAEQVAMSGPESSLQDIQRHTELRWTPSVGQESERPKRESHRVPTPLPI